MTAGVAAPGTVGGATARGDLPTLGDAAGAAGQVGAAGAGGSGGRAQRDKAPGSTDCSSGEACALPLARGLDIAKISLYQAVEVPLMLSWTEVAERPAEVVANKPALLRIHVRLQPEWRGRSATAVLELSSSAGETALFSERRVVRDSSDADLDSTLNIEIPAELLPGDATFRVSLVEQDDVPGEGDSARARWPEAGRADLGERSPGGPLRIVVVPIRYEADGSGRLPDTSPTQLRRFKSTLSTYYPISSADVALRVSEPMSWGDAVLADGTGWDELLYGLVDFMDQQGAMGDEYYYGVLQPADDGGAFCDGQCVAGLAFVNRSPASSQRTNAGIGLGYPGGFAAITMVHELGHMHGRKHAPCGTENADPEYPQLDGSIGHWGYDLAAGNLKSPDDHFDFMGYCRNRWVSAYTYAGLFAWMQGTHLQSMRAYSEPGRWLSLRVGRDGHARRGPSYELSAPPDGEAIEVEWLDADLSVLGTGTGALTPFGDLPGGVVFVPEPAVAAAFARVGGSDPVPM